MPELRHLRAFVAVAEELNFTRAAARLHMAQQAVSKSVRQLEGELGVALLERTTREVATTPAGAALLVSARRALAAADAAFAEAREVGGGLRGRITLGVSPAVGAVVARRAVDALRGEGADPAVSVREVRPGEVARLLQDREVDVVLARTIRPAAGVDSVPLAPTPAVLVLPATHRLAGGDPVSPAQLHGERLLTWSPPGTPYTDMLVAELARAGAAVTPVESRVTGTGDPGEVARGDCVAVMPEGQVATEGVRIVPLAGSFGLPLVLAWASHGPSAAARRLQEGLS